jgi:shikimate dehydrogenase
LPVESRHVGDAVRGLVALGFRGANVTMPHKATVIPFLNTVDEVAARAEAVNTIVVDDGRLAGHNTDIGGFARALHEMVPEGVAGSSVLLVGAGGAARAAALALLAGQVSSLRVANRTEEPARRLVDGLTAVPSSTCVQAVGLGSLSAPDVAGVDVIVNASALGMEGVGKVPAVLTDNIRRGQVVFDVVYRERPTRLLEAAAARGARLVDGRSMLVWQAALAFELWTGREAPLAAMRAAVG